jgi:hypothetical protein
MRAVLQKNIMLASSEGCLKMKMVCFFRTVSIPDNLELVQRDTTSSLPD